MLYRLDLDRRPEAHRQVLVFRAMFSTGALAANVYSPTLAEALARLAMGLEVLGEVLGELAGLVRLPGAP